MPGKKIRKVRRRSWCGDGGGGKKMMSDAIFFRMRARALSLLLIPAMRCSTRPTHQPKLSPQALFLWGGGGERRGCGGRRPKVSRRHIRRARFFWQTVSFLLSLSLLLFFSLSLFHFLYIIFFFFFLLPHTWTFLTNCRTFCSIWLSAISSFN